MPTLRGTERSLLLPPQLHNLPSLSHCLIPDPVTTAPPHSGGPNLPDVRDNYFSANKTITSSPINYWSLALTPIIMKCYEELFQSLFTTYLSPTSDLTSLCIEQTGLQKMPLP